MAAAQLIDELQQLEAEIDQLLADNESTLETLPSCIETHQKKVAALFELFAGGQPDAASLAFLQHTQEKMSTWLELAIEERDETRQTLLNLAQGRKARGLY